MSQTIKLQLEGLSQWVDELSTPSSDARSFEALKVDSPASLPAGSDQRKAAESVLEASIASLTAAADQQPFILILTPPGTTTGRRSPLARRQVAAAAEPPKRIGSGPVFSIDECFTTVGACKNATDACSGRGECVGTKRAGKTCFSCECGATDEKDGVTQWAGARCEKKDISSCVRSCASLLALPFRIADRCPLNEAPSPSSSSPLSSSCSSPSARSRSSRRSDPSRSRACLPPAEAVRRSATERGKEGGALPSSSPPLLLAGRCRLFFSLRADSHAAASVEPRHAPLSRMSLSLDTLPVSVALQTDVLASSDGHARQHDLVRCLLPCSNRAETRFCQR